MVTPIIGKRHGDLNSIPGQDFAFHLGKNKNLIILFPVTVGQTRLFNLGMAISPERKF